MLRTPDEIMENFDQACPRLYRDVLHACLWEIIEDILDSLKLTILGPPHTEDSRDRMEDYWIYETVHDYVVNHYGE